MNRYKTGSDRNQLSVFPMSLDEMISEDNEVRAIELIVDSMCTNGLPFKYATTAATGRKPYNPVDMLKLYVYSYFNGIRSSRKIERECHRNIEVMWLIHNLKPDHKTISEFRRNNKKAIQQVFRDFSMLCDSLGLISKEFVAVDGSKFRASNSKDNYYSAGKVSSLINYYTEAAERYLDLLATAENDDVPAALDVEKLRRKLDEANAKLKNMEDIKGRIAEDGAFCITDPDAKNMVSNNGGHDISYNVQIAVEPTSHIVLAVDTTNEGMDYKQLHNITSKVKDTFDTEEMTVVADRGYYSVTEFKKCAESGIIPIVPKPLRGKVADTSYFKSNFIYDQKNDVYICPRGEILRKADQVEGRKVDVAIYKNSNACRNCPEKLSCKGKSSGTRRITRRPYEYLADEVDARTKANPRMLVLRKSTVEHCFGIVKRMFGFSYFLTRGLENVRTESTMHFLIYNIKRVLNTLGVNRIMKELVV